MKEILTKIGAYIILILGLILSTGLVVFAVVAFVYYPEANLSKKAAISVGITIVGVLAFLITFAVFEALIESVKLEEEVELLEEDIAKRKSLEDNESKQWQSQ